MTGDRASNQGSVPPPWSRTGGGKTQAEPRVRAQLEGRGVKVAAITDVKAPPAKKPEKK